MAETIAHARRAVRIASGRSLQYRSDKKEAGSFRLGLGVRLGAALWLGVLLVATGELRDPLPPELENLALRYFEAYPPEVKA